MLRTLTTKTVKIEKVMEAKNDRASRNFKGLTSDYKSFDHN